MKAIAQRASKEVEDEQLATAKRMQIANGDGTRAAGYTFALLAFEAAWEPADLLRPASARRGGGERGSERGKRCRSKRRGKKAG